MKYNILVDLETCLINGNDDINIKKEIVQFNALMLDESGNHISEFSTCVKMDYVPIDYSIVKKLNVNRIKLLNSPDLRKVIMKFVSWIDERDVMIISCGESDYHQLKLEMRKKLIKNRKMQDLFDVWVDFKKIFNDMLALYDRAMLINAVDYGSIQPLKMGKKIKFNRYDIAEFLKIVFENQIIDLDYIPIKDYVENNNRLSYSLEEILSKKIIIDDTEKIEQEEKQVQINGVMSKVYAFLKNYFVL